jgi:hypothetical protein
MSDDGAAAADGVADGDGGVFGSGSASAGGRAAAAGGAAVGVGGALGSRTDLQRSWCTTYNQREMGAATGDITTKQGHSTEELSNRGCYPRGRQAGGAEQ